MAQDNQNCMDFNQSERHYIGDLLDEDPSSPRKSEPQNNLSTEFADYTTSVTDFSTFSSFSAPVLGSSSSVLMHNNVGPSPNQAFWPEPPPPYTPPMGLMPMVDWDGVPYTSKNYGYTGVYPNQTPPFYQLDNQYYEQCYNLLMKPFDGVADKFKKQQLKKFRKNRSRNNLSQGSSGSAGNFGNVSKPLSRRSSEMAMKTLKKENKPAQPKKGAQLTQLNVKEEEKPKKTVIGWNPIESDAKTIKSAPVGSSKVPDFKQEVKKVVEQKKKKNNSGSKSQKISLNVPGGKDLNVVKKAEERKSRSSSKDSMVKEKSNKTRKSESLNNKIDMKKNPSFESVENILNKTKFVDKNDDGEDCFNCDKTDVFFKYIMLFVMFLSNITVNLVLNYIYKAFYLAFSFCYYGIVSLNEKVITTVKSFFKWSIIYGDLALDYIHLRYDNNLKYFDAKNQGLVKKFVGLEYNLPQPLAVHESINRLSNLDRLDAFSVLGLKYTTNIGDVINARNGTVSFLNSEKSFYPAIDCAIALINKAADSLCSLDGCKRYFDEFSTFDQNLFYEYLKLRAVVFNADYYFGCECGVAHRVHRLRGPPSRYCQKCRCFHSARNREVWMEAKMYGLSWNAFACVDNAVYDITDWISCTHNYIKNPRINSHMVLFQLKKAETTPPLTIQSHNYMKITSNLCPHKMPSAYCAVQKNGTCLRCESCVLCHGRFKELDVTQEPLIIMIGVFEVLSTCSNVVDYSMLERPKKAGRRR
ncbi:unnamed protein product [Bursaphelenchus okinawaensis]|uniref:Cleavage inducing molecular chaperone Jiv domain-containing protein n=1 Tax=Bursaphelenchus okinawaensis TaxID=465554 RepID=A0A811K2M5_9BILA|nr:unnamed protein product [Bursaphelenchus okinawaensis]CAG9090626.1 unnamed protein product [Bursaphelenchus okinawaensis]